MIGHAIGVPANEFWGIDRGTAANVDALLRVITDPTLAEQAIGIISADYYDDDRSNLKALAFKAEGQECAYLPDSTQFKKDKQNVRNGHYPIWGPIHFFASVANGVPRVTRRPGVRLRRLGAQSRPGAARRLHRREPRPLVRDERAAKHGAGPAEHVRAPVPVRLLLRGEPRRERLSARGMHRLQDRERLHQPGAPCVQPRLLRGPVTIRSLPLLSHERSRRPDAISESHGRTSPRAPRRSRRHRAPGCYDVLSAMVLERAGFKRCS